MFYVVVKISKYDLVFKHSVLSMSGSMPIDKTNINIYRQKFI